MEEGGGFKKYKENSNQVQRKTQYRSKKQEKLDLTKERDFRKGELLEKCMMKMLYE